MSQAVKTMYARRRMYVSRSLVEGATCNKKLMLMLIIDATIVMSIHTKTAYEDGLRAIPASWQGYIYHYTRKNRLSGGGYSIGECGVVHKEFSKGNIEQFIREPNV